MARGVFLLACLIGLSGCEVVALTAGANLVTLMHADKTIPDIVLSNQRGKNCSLLHAERNEPYCKDTPPEPREVLADLAANRYCYRTLGAIDCYERPDFLASGHTRIEFANGYLPVRDAPAAVALRQGGGLPMAGIPAPSGPPSGPTASPSDPKAASTATSTTPTITAPGTDQTAALTPPAPAAAKPGPSLAAAPPAVSLTGAPSVKVPPLASLPGQGNY